MTADMTGHRGVRLVPICLLALLPACTPHPHNPPPPPAASSALPPPAPVIVEGAGGAAAEASAPADAASTTVSEAAPAKPHTLAESVNLFARDLDGQLAANKGNLFYSPLSIAAALSMTRAGARGETAKQIARVLHVDPGDKSADASFAKLVEKLASKSGKNAPELAIANRLWPDRAAKLAPAFVKLTKADYGAPVQPLDFAHRPDPARLTINRWVSARTHHKIPDLLPPGSVTPATRLVLTNAIYMKAKWLTPFQKSATEDLPFYVDGTQEKKLPTMQARLTARHGQLGAAEVAELPYVHKKGGPALSMVIILPRQRAGIQAVEKELDQRGFSAYVDALTQGGDLLLSLPRFKATLRVRLKPALAKLGMPLAFGPGADFSGMFASKAGYYIDEVYHQAFVTTDEKGTEAAAATGIVMRATAIHQTTVFHVDHPFVFFIRDAKSGVVLFAGRIDDPAG